MVDSRWRLVDTGKGKSGDYGMDCHRVLISNGLDRLVLLARRTVVDPCPSSSSHFAPPGQRRFYIFVLLPSFTANAGFHSLAFLSFLSSHCLCDHSFLQHSTVRAIQCHLLGHPADSPPPHSHSRALRLVSCPTRNSPSGPGMEFKDEHRSRHHLPALSSGDGLYSLSR